jgi:hypothetical protein
VRKLVSTGSPYQPRVGTGWLLEIEADALVDDEEDAA